MPLTTGVLAAVGPLSRLLHSQLRERDHSEGKKPWLRQHKHQERKNTPHNMVILIGGLARVKTKSEAHVLAAIRYGNLFDRAQIGGARATDYTQVKVDTSGPKQD